MLGGHIKEVKILTRQKTGIIIVDAMSLSHRKNIFRQLCALNWILEGMSQDQQPPVMPPITSCWKLKYVPCSIVFQLGVLCLFLSNGSCQFCFSWGLSVKQPKLFDTDNGFPAREMMSEGTRAEILYWSRVTTQTWIVHLIGSKFASTN